MSVVAENASPSNSGDSAAEADRQFNALHVVMITIVLIGITAMLCYLLLTGHLYFSLQE